MLSTFRDVRLFYQMGVLSDPHNDMPYTIVGNCNLRWEYANSVALST